MKLLIPKLAFTITTFVIGLFVIPQTVLASCGGYFSCSSCVSNSNCTWAISPEVCMSKADAQGFSSSGLTTSCGGSSPPTQQSTPVPTRVYIRPTSTPRPVSTRKPTSTPISKKASGRSCRSDADCLSGNCKNSMCCVRGEICCTEHSSCSESQYCSTSYNRYYCRTKLSEGVSCTEDYQCQSGFCDSSSKKCGSASEESVSTSGKAVCGNQSCEYWLGENCTSCSGDCDEISDFCCLTSSQYANTLDWQNQIFNLFDPPGDSIPNGRLVVSKGISQNLYFSSYQPNICSNGQVVPGECIRTSQCTKGVCVDNKCTVALSDESQEITDEVESQEIFDDQTEYAREEIWINVYDKLDDDLITSSKVSGDLEIELEVQGSTAGSIPEVTVGKDVETRLTVINTTSFSMAIVAGIVYPGQLMDTFRLEEKKYTLSCSPVNGTNPLTSVIGAANAKRLGGKSYILPPRHQLIIFSKVTPKQEGYLDISGIVYFSKEKMYANSTLVEMIIAPNNFETTFQKSEVSDSILVNKKKCWWPICL